MMKAIYIKPNKCFINITSKNKSTGSQYIKLLVFASLTALTACGGGVSDDSNSEKVTTPPVASNFLPADDDNAAALDAAVSASFDKDLFALTVTSNSFTLENSSGEIIPAIINYDVLNKLASLVPESDLALFTQYTANLKSDITDLDGNPLADTSWQFLTREGEWQRESSMISDDVASGFVSIPNVSFDGKGKALTVWSDDAGNLWMNNYVLGDDWDSAELLGFNEERASSPQIVADSKGNALLVWMQLDEDVPNSRASIWSNRYITSTGWSTPELVEMGDDYVDSVQTAMDDEGNALIVWRQKSDLTYYNIWSKRYTVAKGWGVAEPIDTVSTGIGVRSESPKISINSSGYAIAVWEQNDTFQFSDNNILSNRYTPDEGWGEPQLLETNTISRASSPQVGIDSNGNALVVWQQNGERNREQIWSNRYVVGSGWVGAEVIEDDLFADHIAHSPQIVVNKKGDAVAVWQQRATGGNHNIWSNSYSPGTGWGQERLVETDDTQNASYSQVSIDETGNALAVWEQQRGSIISVWSNRYTFADGWQAARVIERETVCSSVHPQIAMDAKGRAMAVWLCRNGSTSNIRANKFK